MAIHDVLRGQVRKAEGKKLRPTAAIIDSQSVRIAEGGEERGFDGKKKPRSRRAGVIGEDKSDPYGTRTRVTGVKGRCPNH